MCTQYPRTNSGFDKTIGTFYWRYDSEFFASEKRAEARKKEMEERRQEEYTLDLEVGEQVKPPRTHKVRKCKSEYFEAVIAVGERRGPGASVGFWVTSELRKYDTCECIDSTQVLYGVLPKNTHFSRIPRNGLYRVSGLLVRCDCIMVYAGNVWDEKYNGPEYFTRATWEPIDVAQRAKGARRGG